MNGALKMVFITSTVVIIGLLYYFVLPQILPSNFFALFAMSAMFFVGLLFGLALFGIVFGLNKLCKRIKNK